jgi:hypothetical protein
VGDGLIAPGAGPVDGLADHTEYQALQRRRRQRGRAERLRSLGSGGACSVAAMRFQICWKTDPASSPPATLEATDSGT